MKTHARLLSLLLAIVMLLCAVPRLSGARAAAAGDRIRFGNYPQTRVTNAATLTALNKTDTPWHSYNFYTGVWINDGEMQPSDYTEYRDATVDGIEYRAVRFSHYRPYYTGYGGDKVNDKAYTWQDDNGYAPDTVYWFRFEPITWIVLDPAAGLVLAESILDAQPFNNYILARGDKTYGDAACSFYASDYSQSFIREWLNGDFITAAFTKGQKAKLLDTALDNKSSYNAVFNAPACTDQVFLPSVNDALNTAYGFSETYAPHVSRRAQGTDYAKCLGLQVYGGSYAGNSNWRLRTPYDSLYAAVGTYEGGVGKNFLTYDTRAGVRPACRLSALTEDTATTCLNNAEHKYSAVTAPATLKADGKTVKTCAVCGRTEKTVIAKASKVSLSKTKFVYNGSAQKPALTVKNSAGKAIPGKYYTAVWSNASSRAVGTYTVKLTFKGNYSGEKTLTYRIVPKAVTGLKNAAAKTGSVKLAWAKVTGAKYYQVYALNAEKAWKYVKTVSVNTATVTKIDGKALTAGKTCYFKVRALDESKKCTGAFSAALKTGTRTAAPAVTALTSPKAGGAAVTWGKVTGAKTYTVLRSADGKTWKTVKTGLTGAEYTLTGLPSGKRVYVKLLAVNAYGVKSAMGAGKSTVVK